MIYVISKSTFGSYNVRDIQCNANWDCCPYSDYALIPENMVEGILATKGYCDITLNSAGTEVASYKAKTIPSVPEECCGTNTVLSVNGVTADLDGEVTLDAADVGAAPSGFGLGTNAVTISDINSTYKTGFYKWDTRPSGAPFSYAVMQVIARTDGSCVQIVHGMSSTYENVIARRKGNANTGEWQEWEYLNPRMDAGTPYRTVERWNDKSVYAVLVNLGKMPDSSSKSVDTGLAVSTYQIVDIELSLMNASGNYIRTSTKDTLDYYIDGTVSGKSNWQATVATTSYYADYNGYLLIKYVKK